MITNSCNSSTTAMTLNITSTRSSREIKQILLPLCKDLPMKCTMAPFAKSQHFPPFYPSPCLPWFLGAATTWNRFDHAGS